MSNRPSHHESRRGFIRGSSLLLAGAIPGSGIANAAMAGAVAEVRRSPERVKDRETLRVGLIGCGYRGISLASQALSARSEGMDVRLAAVADVFPDRLQQALRSLKGKHSAQVTVDSRSRFVGLEGYRGLLESEVDLVLLVAPQAFRPLHFEAAVQAGTHIYAEKPIAIDAPGVRRFLEANELAKKKELSVGLGLGARNDEIYAATIRELQNGAIGKLIVARSYRDTPAAKAIVRHKSQTELEFQLRNWRHFQWASGGTIVEQHVQDLDVSNWLLGGHPLVAHGVGGRNSVGMNLQGDVCDHYCVEFTYDNGVKLLSMCRQTSDGRKGVSETVHGSEGWCDLSAGKIYDLQNELVWQVGKCGEKPAPINRLISAIMTASAFNEGDRAAESTMTAILGRMAAESGRPVKWQDCLQSSSVLAFQAAARGREELG